MALFQWTTSVGVKGSGDAIPILPTDQTITELCFIRDPERMHADRVRKHEPHPIHQTVIEMVLPAGLCVLRAENCKLRSFPILQLSILEIYMHGNNIITLPDLSAYTNLIVMDFSNNNISEIVNPLPPRLASLDLSINALRRFDRMVLPFTVGDLSTYSNPKTFQFGLPDRNAPVRINEKSEKLTTIYTNSENVHSKGVQGSTTRNITHLVNYRNDVPNRPDICKRIQDAYGCIDNNPGTILEAYIISPYAMHGVTLFELLNRVWLRIEDAADDKRKELMQRFKEEVIDGDDKCTNGMIVRLANVFVGFDEGVTCVLEPKEILQARIPATIERLREYKYDDLGKYWLAVYKQTMEDLLEVELDETQWVEWLDPLYECLYPYFVQDCSKRISFDEPNHRQCTIVKDILIENGLRGFQWEVQKVLNEIKANQN